MNAELAQRSTAGILFQDWTELPVDGTRIDRNEEVLRFKQFQFCAYRLSRLYRRAVKSFRATIADEYPTWFARYHNIRQRLVDANLGLVYDLIGRTRFNILDRDDMSSEGMTALLRAVDTFDPWRGFRFSTYACNAILRAFSRASSHDARRRSRFTDSFDTELEQGDLSETQRTDSKLLYIERLRDIMCGNRAELSPVERDVLSMRFCQPADNGHLTLGCIGRQLNVSKERVRQIQHVALRKLRRAITVDYVLK